jgi:hypothetical protein
VPLFLALVQPGFMQLGLHRQTLYKRKKRRRKKKKRRRRRRKEKKETEIKTQME